jgi:hypothetical protein
MSGDLKIPSAPGDGTGGAAGASSGFGGSSGSSGGGGVQNFGGMGTAGASKGGSGGDPDQGALGGGGSGASAGGGAAGSAGQGSIEDAKMIPLTPSGGWVDANTNVLKIQGGVFGFADTTSAESLMKDLSGANMCIQGTAAKVDMNSSACVTKMFTPPATDCYGEYWGSALALNLNQPLDMATDPPTGGTPLTYDASALKGFSFEITGNVVPAPSAFRFKLDDGSTEFCNPASSKLKVGVNTFLFSDLVASCWTTPNPTGPTAQTAQSRLIKLVWQVVTNTSAPVPYDFCVSNLRALLK